MSQSKADEPWDVFVSFAGPDKAQAEALARELHRLGRRVFVSGSSLKPGEEWPKSLAGALRSCRLVAVLLSENSAQATYQKEEILFATRLAEKEGLEIVPIYLSGVPANPADWEVGFLRLQWIDLNEVGPREAAERLDQRFDEAAEKASAPEASAGNHEREYLRTSGDFFHRAALKIDRTKQWHPIVTTCQAGGSALFLLQGPREQNLDLFIYRLCHYLAEEVGQFQRPVTVPLKLEYSRPRSVAGWENHLRDALVGEGGPGGKMEVLLREAARTHPLFLVFCKKPIKADSLDDVELDALEEFVEERLPTLITQASNGGHPIRALLAIYYDNPPSREERRRLDALDQRALRGCRRAGFAYLKLLPLEPLKWGDVENYLDNLPKRPPAGIYRALRTAFDRLDRDNLEFRQVVDLLEQEFDE